MTILREFLPWLGLLALLVIADAVAANWDERRRLKRLRDDKTIRFDARRRDE